MVDFWSYLVQFIDFIVAFPLGRSSKGCAAIHQVRSDLMVSFCNPLSSAVECGKVALYLYFFSPFPRRCSTEPSFCPFRLEPNSSQSTFFYFEYADDIVLLRNDAETIQHAFHRLALEESGRCASHLKGSSLILT